MSALGAALGLAGGGVVSLVGAGGKTSLMFALAAELAAAGHTVLATTTTRIEPPTAEQAPELVVAADAPAAVSACRRALARSPLVAAVAGSGDDPRKLVGFAPGALEEIRRSGLFRWILVEADGAARRPLKAPAAHEPVVPAASGWVMAVAGLGAVGKPFDKRWVFRLDAFARLAGLAPGQPVGADAVAAVLADPRGAFKGAPAAARRVVFLNQADDAERAAAGRRVAERLAALAPPTVRVVIGRLLPAPRVIEVRQVP